MVSDKSAMKTNIKRLGSICAIGLVVLNVYVYGLIYAFKLTNNDMYNKDACIKLFVICTIIADCCVLFELFIWCIDIFLKSHNLGFIIEFLSWAFIISMITSFIFWIISMVAYLMRADDIMSNSDGQISTILNLFIPMCPCIVFLCILCFQSYRAIRNENLRYNMIRESVSNLLSNM